MSGESLPVRMDGALLDDLRARRRHLFAGLLVQRAQPSSRARRAAR